MLCSSICHSAWLGDEKEHTRHRQIQPYSFTVRFWEKKMNLDKSTRPPVEWMSLWFAPAGRRLVWRLGRRVAAALAGLCLGSAKLCNCASALKMAAYWALAPPTPTQRQAKRHNRVLGYFAAMLYSRNFTAFTEIKPRMESITSKKNCREKKIPNYSTVSVYG